ncbi:DUF3540 domain-containing protein [Aquabacterium humicola]|uniref:DUF3540 domain-containing protein n=1 Tax=Aquabacterium humicola TaxID=3237377 RepID=UPI0025435E38|nr:DUF3540 domain-containing protein [Rubrivivax pictus]
MTTPSLASAATTRPAPLPPAQPAALLPAHTPTPWQGPGVVCAEADGAWVVNADTGSFRARLAASCLLQPQVGDTVWCCGVVCDAAPAAADAGQAARYWITLVLERAETAGARVQLPADATLASADGRLALQADELQVRSGRLSLLTEQASVIGGAWEAVLGAVQLTGQTLRSVFDRVTHTAQQHRRVTTGIDAVHADVLELQANQLASVHGEHVIVQGERLIKSRAAQIHMG